MDASKLLPYIVPPGYVEGQRVAPDGLVRHLGHDVYVMLVHDLEGLCRNVLPEELDGTPQEAYDIAIDNLVRLVRAKEIEMAVLKGPRDEPFIVAEGHWTAAACILLPRLFELASEALSADVLLAAVPSRGSLLVFRLIDDRYTDEMRRFMRRAERGETKLVSNSVFTLTAAGASPHGPTLPPPKHSSFLRRWFGA